MVVQQSVEGLSMQFRSLKTIKIKNNIDATDLLLKGKNHQKSQQFCFTIDPTNSANLLMILDFYWSRQYLRLRQILESHQICQRLVLGLQYNHIVEINRMAEYGENLDFSQLLNGQHFSNLFQSEQLMMHSSEPLFANQNHYSEEKGKQQSTTDKKTNVLSPHQHWEPRDYSLRANQIDSHSDTQRLNDIVRKGSKDDTVKLNINFKTIFMNYFKELQLANELTTQEYKRFIQFSRRSPSLKSFATFCSAGSKEADISRICLAFISSSVIVQKILQSRCQISTKMQMIKFLNVLQLNAMGTGRIYKWKNNYKQ